MDRYKRRFVLLIAVLLLTASMVCVIGCVQKKEEEKTGKKTKNKDPATELILATTTSTKDSGLLDEIIPDFEEEYNVTVKVVAVGTGAALEMGEKGEADILLVHARASEDEFMEAEYGSVRKDVMYNDFVVLGPKDDSAGVKNMDSVTDVFDKIAKGKSVFITRGDDSGTYKKEKKMWEAAETDPSGDWYRSTGQGMGASLQVASEQQAYVLTDRATYLSQKDNLDLEIMVEGDDKLFNPYGVMAVNPDKFSKVNNDDAMDFIDWLTSIEVQEKIGEYGKDEYGQALFTPDSDQWNKENN